MRDRAGRHQGRVCVVRRGGGVIRGRWRADDQVRGVLGGHGSGRRARRWWLLAAVAAIVVVGAGCSTGSGDSEGSVDQTEVLDAIDAAPIDRRGELRAQLGAPDAFIISAGEFDGTVSRFETWRYYSAATQVDLVDGEIAWNVPIDPLPDGSLLPLLYDPDEFELLSSTTSVFAALGDVELDAIDDAAIDLGVEGAELWAGEQLLLAFVDDQLIYVETYPLVPDDEDVTG